MRLIFFGLIFLFSLQTEAQCWREFSAGKSGQTIAISTDGTLWGFGQNNYGQLGDGTYIDKASFVQIGTDSNWDKISSGYGFTIALKTDGTLWAWGLNSYNQLGDGTNVNKNYPIQIGTDTDWETISSGYYHTLVTKTDKTLWGFGYNTFGQIGFGNTSVITEPTQIGTDSNWESISSGNFHNLAIKSNKSLWAWGINDFGELGDGTSVDKNSPIQIGSSLDWEKISCGSDYFSLGIKTDGTLWSWGSNHYGQLGDGTLVNKNVPQQIGNETNWRDIFGGIRDSHAIKTDGTLWSWGSNEYGQLGNGSNVNENVPLQIGADLWLRIVSYGHSLVLKNDGSLWSYGANFYGEIGDGTTTHRSTPFNISCGTLDAPSYLLDKNSLIVFPNPSSDFIQILNFNESQEYKIFNLLGKVVQSGSVSNKEKIDVKQLNRGIYLIKLKEINIRFIID
jgi:alpha-tubulin suppressor-like RCC1 family protein